MTVVYTDNIQTRAKWSDCLLGEVTLPLDSRLSEAKDGAVCNAKLTLTDPLRKMWELDELN